MKIFNKTVEEIIAKMLEKCREKQKENNILSVGADVELEIGVFYEECTTENLIKNFNICVSHMGSEEVFKEIKQDDNINNMADLVFSMRGNVLAVSYDKDKDLYYMLVKKGE